MYAVNKVIGDVCMKVDQLTEVVDYFSFGYLFIGLHFERTNLRSPDLPCTRDAPDSSFTVVRAHRCFISVTASRV